jgi:hypothetical protein
MEENVIEVCVGVGMDQFTPEYIKIVIPRDVVQNKEETIETPKFIVIDSAPDKYIR